MQKLEVPLQKIYQMKSGQAEFQLAGTALSNLNSFITSRIVSPTYSSLFLCAFFFSFLLFVFDHLSLGRVTNFSSRGFKKTFAILSASSPPRLFVLD